MTAREDYHHGDIPAQAISRAVALLAEQPAAKLSMRQVATDLGVAHRALYNHFASKDDFLAAIAARGFRKLAGELANIKCAINFARCYLQFALANRHIYDVMMAQSNRHIANMSVLNGAVQNVITLAVAHLAPDESDDVAQRREVMRIWMMLHGGIMLYRNGILRLKSDDEAIDEILTILNA